MILLPYTHPIPPETAAAAAEFTCVEADVSGDDTLYWELMAFWWASDEPEIVTVEHDIVVSAAAIREVRDCPQPWCSSWYSFELGELYGLGLAKFSLGLRRAVPDCMDLVAAVDQAPIHPPKHWCSMDILMQGVLKGRGFQPHLHRPAGIRHLGAVRSHVACR